MLCGNPAVDVFNGLKLAAGGELGIGVGEEEWGSGEREVLEGFIGRTDGLVDLIVSRFGDDPESNQAQPHPIHQIGALSTSKGITNEWQSGDRHPGPSDGVIFSGVGAITRSSIKSISGWMELLFRYGQDAYGVRENASATYRRKRKKPSSFHNQSDRTDKSPASSQREPQNTKTLKSSSPTICRRQSISPAGIPPPIVKPTIRSPTKADDLQPSDKIVTTEKESKIQPDGTTDDSLSGTETLMKYLSLGVYGSKWGIPARKTPTRLPIPYSHNQDGDEGASSRSSKNEFQHSQNERASPGHFMIGLQGDLDNDVGVGHERGVEISTDHDDAVENRSWNNRTMLRTLQVERLKRKSDSADNGSTDELYIDRLRVVVYVVRLMIPFRKRGCSPIFRDHRSSSLFFSSFRRDPLPCHPFTSHCTINWGRCSVRC